VAKYIDAMRGRRLSNRMDQRRVLKSTGIVAMSTFASRILGFARDVIIASTFEIGGSGLIDCFYVAFRIPNLFRRLVAEGALTISFIPVYTEYLTKRTVAEALALAQKTLSILLLVLALIVSLGILFSPQIVSLFAPGFSHGDYLLTVSLNRMMFPYLFLVALVAFCMGYLNSHRSFFASAISPVLLNVGIIAGALLLGSLFRLPIYGLALGVLIGGVMQLILQIPYMVKHGFRFRFLPDFRDPGIRRIFLLIGPYLLGIAIHYVNQLVCTAYASMTFKGAVSYLYYSDRLLEVVLGVFIVSIGNVILPEMSVKTANDDMDGMKRIYSRAAGASLFLAMPAAGILMACAVPIISVMFMRGKFSYHDVQLTASALFYAAAGLASIALQRITLPAFYSMKNTRIPVLSSFVNLIVNAIAGWFLMRTNLRHAGLTLSISIAATVQLAIIAFFLSRMAGRDLLKRIGVALVKTAGATVLFAIPAYLAQRRFDWEHAAFLERLVVLGGIVGASGALYLIGCFIFRVEELRHMVDIIKRLRRRLGWI
jgi:putative peptidoglycan lipid II flippase